MTTHDGPRDIAPIGRSKLFMPDRGICMTPSIHANGPSYMKPIPPPVTRPADAARHDDAPPIVITRTVASRQLVVALSSAAAAKGVQIGLTLTEANALCPGLLHFDHDPAKDARALEALARWMMRFSPTVALPLPVTPGRGLGRGASDARTTGAGNSRAPSPSPQPSPRVRGEGEMPDTIFLDLTGCARAFGSIATIVEDVIASLRRLRLSANVAVAPTPAAAWALASFGENGRIVESHNIPAALAPLAVDALHLDDDITTSLHHLGLETIGHVMNLPRAALPARFGPALLLRLDQALGRMDEPLVPLVYHAPLEARIDFDGAVDSIETIYLVFKRLIGEIVVELTRRGAGAREMTIEFFRPYAQTIAHTIRLSRPSRDPVNLFNLLRCATENLDGEDCGDGFLGIRLFVPRFERIHDEQIALLDHERYAGEIELAQLIERLCVRLGDEAIAQPVLAESHVPERAFDLQWLGHPARALERSGSAVALERDAQAMPQYRPLQLLSTPTEIRVMVSPSDDRDGRPILFRLDDVVHEIAHALGPERIAGEWWRGHDRTRDYFDVEDQQGNRFWVFRVQETNRWYLHGLFN